MPKENLGIERGDKSHFDDFQNCIESTKLDDLRYRGLFYIGQTSYIRRKIRCW